MAVQWLRIERMEPTCEADWPCNLAGQPSFLLALPLRIGYLEHCLCWTRRQNSFWKCINTWPADQGDVASRPHLGSVEPVLCTTSFPHVILSVTMPHFWHNEDMHGFSSIWCFFIIWCSSNGRSTKLIELISNRHLSSISWMKCRYVGGKYMHFMTANKCRHPHWARDTVKLAPSLSPQHRSPLWACKATQYIFLSFWAYKS
jgi:hypothetical protein